jgi:hypothetical protein
MRVQKLISGSFIEYYERSRSRLIDFYTQSATFGYTVNDGSGIRRKKDSKLPRDSSMTGSHEGCSLDSAISAFGNYSIINTMRRLPACVRRRWTSSHVQTLILTLQTHRTSDGKLVYDAMRIRAPNKGAMAYCDILVTIHGEFVEVRTCASRFAHGPADDKTV